MRLVPAEKDQGSLRLITWCWKKKWKLFHAVIWTDEETKVETDFSPVQELDCDKPYEGFMGVQKYGKWKWLNMSCC